MPLDSLEVSTRLAWWAPYAMGLIAMLKRVGVPFSEHRAKGFVVEYGIKIRIKQ
jgi:hypothetical protein